MANILLVEDSPEIFQIVKSTLGDEHTLAWSETLEAAHNEIIHKSFDLILLDVQLPDGNGLDFLIRIQQVIRAQSTTVFFLTANAEISSKVLGFSLGADDYIVKPFVPLELKARIDARLKKSLKGSQSVLQWPQLKVDRHSQDVFVMENGQLEKVKLTSIEYKLLILLATRPNSVILRQEILDFVWGRDVFVDSRAVDTHISKLRKKLMSASNMIESVHGSGYKFVVTS